MLTCTEDKKDTEEYVILVDENDIPSGIMEKMEAHEKGVLHRAFSFFIFNSSGEMLIQQRALTKYHSGGLWTNACCSHPRPDETVQSAAYRRMQEEMGLKCNPEFAFSFIYRAELDQNLIEHELDYVFTGVSDDIPVLNPDEVMDWKYITVTELRDSMQKKPELYTAWFKIVWEKVCEWKENQSLLG